MALPEGPRTLEPEAPGADGSAVRRRRGGRSERIRESVAQAVLELFRERQFDFGMPEVAARAGIHRATVYRRWPTRGDLIAEALTSFFRTVEIPDTGTWEGDIQALASTLARFFADPVEIGVVTSLAVDSDPLASDVIQAHWSPIVAAMMHVVDRAKARGEVDPGLRSGRLIEMLISPFVVHSTLVRRPVSRRHVKDIADLVVRAGAAAAAGVTH